MPTRRRPSKAEHIVVIGASAGGVDALLTLLAHLPADFQAPIVVGQHIDPQRPSQLHEILASHCPLPIRTVTAADDPLEPGVVYVVPADRNVYISNNSVHIDEGIPGAHPKPSVDMLFSTAAEAYGEGVIAVILSGRGADGAAGAQVVKEAGGTVIIQDPETAAYPGMPLALAPTTVDIVAMADRIGGILRDLVGVIGAPTGPEEQRLLGAFLEEVRARAGIDFSTYKTPTLMRRLLRRVAATDTGSLAEYFEYLHSHPEEYTNLVSTFLIKVTEFFRDPDLFEYLQRQVIPDLIASARKRGNVLRIWSAGCATGEESYTLAILLSEALGNELEQFHIRIFATDADADAIAFARRGLYPTSALGNVPADMLSRYFLQEENYYQVRKRVRSLVVFGQHDLGGRAPFPNIDLVTCRNVLIYFTSALQQRTLKLCAYSLRNGGYLVLGKAEALGPSSEFFTPVESHLKVYQRVGDRVLLPPAQVLPTQTQPPQRMSLWRQHHASIQPVRVANDDVQRARNSTERMVLMLPVGVVVIDRRYDIQSINNAARHLLSIHGTAVGDDVIHLAYGLPSTNLREAIDHAFSSAEPTALDEVAVDDPANGEQHILSIRCIPQTGELSRARVESVALLVEDVTAQVLARRTVENTLTSATAELEAIRAATVGDRQTHEVQVRRLAETNRQLIDANQDLTTTNAELRETNEALLVSAEEAQAAIEEVETLNEELQATNEELETLNEELQSTIEELNTTNDDMHARSAEIQAMAQTAEEERARLQAILANMADAVLVVQRDAVPLLTNAAYDRLFGSGLPVLIRDDGRPLAADETPQQRAANGESFTLEFSMLEGEGAPRWFEASGRPVVDNEGRVRWGVVVIRDITERSLHRIQDEFIAMASHELRTPLTPLQTYLQMLERNLDSTPDDAPERRYVRGALAQTERLSRLVHDLLDVRRLQSGSFSVERERVELNPMVAQTVEDARTMTIDQQLHLSSVKEPLYVLADTQRIQQVLFNLIDNATRYAADSPTIDLRLLRVNSFAEIQVQDYGPGISPDERERIFSRNFQSRANGPATRGLGLGLYIAREIVQAHGGTLTVKSERGSGSTFVIRLPLID